MSDSEWALFILAFIATPMLMVGIMIHGVRSSIKKRGASR